jgi:hypothetical protein
LTEACKNLRPISTGRSKEEFIKATHKVYANSYLEVPGIEFRIHLNMNKKANALKNRAAF